MARGGRRLRRALKIASVLLGAYVLSYVAFRATHTEVWERDGRAYVIFPWSAPVLYVLYRPLSYLDEALTGTGAHIGPHR